MVVLYKTLESPLGSKKIKPVNPTGHQPWLFTGSTDAETESPILWPPDVKSWLIGKEPDAGKDWGQEEEGVTEDEMVVWNHWLNGQEFEQTLEGSERQGSLECCSPWGRRVSDTTERLDKNDYPYYLIPGHIHLAEVVFIWFLLYRVTLFLSLMYSLEASH